MLHLYRLVHFDGVSIETRVPSENIRQRVTFCSVWVPMVSVV